MARTTGINIIEEPWAIITIILTSFC